MTAAVIFDVDGTLVDSVDLHAKAWQDAFREFGHNVEFKAVRDQIGKGGDELMPVFLSRAEMESQSNALDARRAEILRSEYLPQIKAFPEVRALFERIVADGKKIVLASSAKGDELRHYKKLARIDDLLQAETSSDDAGKSKPHPDIFEAALSRLGRVDRDRVIVVGDTPYDAVAAKRAGLRALGVLCGGWSEGDLRRAGCMACYRDPADLLVNYASSLLAD